MSNKYIDAWILRCDINDPPCCDDCAVDFDICKPKDCMVLKEAEQQYNDYWIKEDERLYKSFLEGISRAEAKLLDTDVYNDWKEMHDS